jgi:hypothetical protein
MSVLPRTDFLTAEEQAQIADDVLGLFADAHLSVPITYRSYQSRVFVPSTGVTTITYSDTSVRAVRLEVPTREVVASQGLFQQGDLRFVIARATLPTTPNKEDRLVDGAAVYSLVSWNTDALSQLWRVVARLVA